VQDLAPIVEEVDGLKADLTLLEDKIKAVSNECNVLDQRVEGAESACRGFQIVSEKCDSVAGMTERLAAKFDAPRPSPLDGIAALIGNQSAQILNKVDSLETQMAARIELLESVVAGLDVSVPASTGVSAQPAGTGSDLGNEGHDFPPVMCAMDGGSPGLDCERHPLAVAPALPPCGALVDLVPAGFGCFLSLKEVISLEVSLSEFETCRFDGNCWRGGECWFRHSSADLRAELKRLKNASTKRPERRSRLEHTGGRSPRGEANADPISDEDAAVIEMKYAEECCKGCGYHPSLGCASACPSLSLSARASPTMQQNDVDEPADGGVKAPVAHMTTAET
jgi:hypothetical protein